MAQVIQLASCAFMSSLSVNGRTKSLEAHECDLPFEENQSTDSPMSQRQRRERNAGINIVSAMRPGFANIIETVHI